MPCIATGVNGLLCKYHEGLIYADDFTTPLAGRWTVITDHNGDPADKWSIVDVGDIGHWTLTASTKALRVRHDQVENPITLMIVNNEMPDMYVLDEAERDFPWFNVRMDLAGVVDPGHFPYDLAGGGIAHRVHGLTPNFTSLFHGHLCGILSTWVFIFILTDNVWASEKSPLVNLIDGYWGVKHNVGDGYWSADQFGTDGWSLGTDYWAPTITPYTGTNGKFGLITRTCSPYTVDGYVYFYDIRIVETNYIEIRGIPPWPDGAGSEGTFVNGGTPLPAGSWLFRADHPGIGVTNGTITQPADGVSEITLPFDHNCSTWQTVSWYFLPLVGEAVLLDIITPPTGVNGGDVYWASEPPPPNWPPTNGGESVIPGGCAEYYQIAVYAPVLNDVETNFIPGDDHVIARTFKGFGTDDPTDFALRISTHDDAANPIIEKNGAPVDNGDGTFDMTFSLTPTETRQIGWEDAKRFQIIATLTSTLVTTINAGIIKGNRPELST